MRVDKITILKIIALVIIALIPRLFGIQRPLWADEGISIATLRIGLITNPLFFGTTTNLPLYFYILKLVKIIINSDSYIFLRFTSVFFSIITAVILYLFIEKYFSIKIALIMYGIFCFSPLQIYYAQELRPYSLIQFLILINLIGLYLYIKSHTSKSLCLLGISSLLILLTHFTGYYFLLIEGLFLIFYYLKSPSSYIKILLVYLINGFIGILLVYAMSRNPHFYNSLGDLEIGGRWNPQNNILYEISLFVNRFKEVITFYYWFGLYYFSLDWPVQFVFKKVIAGLFLLAVVFIWKEKNQNIKNTIIFVIYLLISILFLAYLGEKAGYFPFGGRHIMPYSILLFFIISYVLDKLKDLGILLFVTTILIFITFQFCFIYKVPDELLFATIPNQIFSSCYLRIF